MSRPLFFLWLAVQSGLLIAACSKSASPTTAPTATSVPSPTLAATAAPVATPIEGAVYGGTLNVAGREPILHQDVHQEVSPALSTWGPGIAYSRLLRFKSGPDVVLPSLAVECELCVSWEMEDDRTYVFYLRDDVRWHDLPPVNGRPFVADDVVFSYQRQRQQGWPNSGLLRSVEFIEALDPHTVRITLTAPDADFLFYLADARSKIVAREAVELHGDLRGGPTIGTGPWVWLEDQTPGSYTFERNPDYFETGLPLVDTLRIHIIEDSFTRSAAFANAIIDIHRVEVEEWTSFQQRHPDTPFLAIKELGAGLEVGLKTTAPPFDDLRVRKAAFMAMDPWGAIEDVWHGMAFVSQGVPAAEADWLLQPEEFDLYFGDPAQARALLAEAGVETPVPVTIEVGDFGEPYLAHAQRIAEELRAVGFEPLLNVVSQRAFGEDVWVGGNYQMFVGPIAPVTTPNAYLFSILHSQGSLNTTGHRDTTLDELIEAQAVEHDPEKRKELIQSIQRRALENAYRFMPATRVSVWTWSPQVQNFHPNFAGFDYSHWARVWLEGTP